MRDKRIRFYRWVSFRIFKQEEACYRNKLSSILYAVLFPLDWFYARNTRVNYSYETDTFTIRGAKIYGHVFDEMKKAESKDIILKKNEYGKWVIARLSIDKNSSSN